MPSAQVFAYFQHKEVELECVCSALSRDTKKMCLLHVQTTKVQISCAFTRSGERLYCSHTLCMGRKLSIDRRLMKVLARLHRFTDESVSLLFAHTFSHQIA